MTTPPTFDPGFTTAEMTEVWTAAARTTALLEFEGALALGLAYAGVAPAEDAAAVDAACSQPLADPEAVLASTWEKGTPLIALLEEVSGRLTEDQAAWLHHGATTQDAVDTAQMLQTARALDVLESSMIRAAATMLDLAKAHRAQPQIGRTFLQHARPTTFGMRAAQWLETTLLQIEELRSIRGNLAIQLGGPVGNAAGFGPRPDEVVRAVADRLGLICPRMAWHADRSRVWRIVAAVASSVQSMAKIALDVALLAQSDTGEVTVRAGDSSSMAGKHNPIDAIRLLAAADACRGAAAMITGSGPQELDRGLGSWHVEWLALPLMFQSAAAASESLELLVGSIRVQPDTMGSRVSPEKQPAQEILDRQIDAVAFHYEQVVGG